MGNEVRGQPTASSRRDSSLRTANTGRRHTIPGGMAAELRREGQTVRESTGRLVTSQKLPDRFMFIMDVVETGVVLTHLLCQIISRHRLLTICFLRCLTEACHLLTSQQLGFNGTSFSTRPGRQRKENTHEYSVDMKTSGGIVSRDEHKPARRLPTD